MDLKENRRDIVRERLCLAARAVPAAALRESCGAVREAGWQRGERAGLEELGVTDEGLIFIWCTPVSFVSVGRRGVTGANQERKRESIKISPVCSAL